MAAFEHYIKFLQEYQKLLERGVKDIYTKNNAPNYFWYDDIERLKNDDLCTSIFSDLFQIGTVNHGAKLLSLKKPIKPDIVVPEEYLSIIVFNETKNKFESIEHEDGLKDFKNSSVGQNLLAKIENFQQNKTVYSKLFRAYNDIKNDSSLEIVLSVGLIQFCQEGGTRGLKKINQHLFHFPLKIELNSNNWIIISFSDEEKPSSDFFFLNHDIPIEKSNLSVIVDKFDQAVGEKGSTYIFDDDFRNLIKNDLQRLSEFSVFEDTIKKPKLDHFQVDQFKISFSPAINIKRKKPRFFEKLTEDILKFKEENEVNAELFNLLIREPEAVNTNTFRKENYFINELFEKYKGNTPNLNGEEDFSAFFPLPFNKEQKQIYKNYLENRLTVVTGPPGTGKSHTIVNILCSLLAQGKRVLVTAQTDKALESLLDKIPKDFDDLIFTQIQLENNRARFSLETSINRIKNILVTNSHSEVEKQISDLNNLKGEYVNLKNEIYEVLQNEYKKINLNESFIDLRSFELYEKLLQKEKKEWEWIKDPVTSQMVKDCSHLLSFIHDYRNLSEFTDSSLNKVKIDLPGLISKLDQIDFENYLSNKTKIFQLQEKLNIDNASRKILLTLNIEEIQFFSGTYCNADIHLKNPQEVKRLKQRVKRMKESSIDVSVNIPFSVVIEKADKFLNDISTYLAQIKIGKEKVSKWDRLLNSRFKDVKYLEEIVINRNNCDDRLSLELFEDYLRNIKEVNNQLMQLQTAKFINLIDEDSSLNAKKIFLNESIEKIETNFILSNVLEDNQSDIIKFAQLFQIEKYDLEGINKHLRLIREKLTTLKRYDVKEIEHSRELSLIFDLLKDANLPDGLPMQPLEDITTLYMYQEFLKTLKLVSSDVEKTKKFNFSMERLNQHLPNTLKELKEVPASYLTKENFEFAQVNQYLQENKIINLQQKKEELNQITNNIYNIKCKILFDLARDNFKNTFQKNNIDKFINLLNEYQTNSTQAKRGIKDKVKYQILARKNGIKISEKLSCWVMKFNDVLNSVGDQPEIFDCIIVDEASQLDFNSLILGYYAKNMIVVGDEKQTSPPSLTGADGDSFDAIKNQYLDYLGGNKVHIRSDMSLFTLSTMSAGRANSSLVEHFRCVPEIIEFSKSEYYNHSLRPLKQINTERLSPLKPIHVKYSFIEDKVVIKEIEAIKNYLFKILRDPNYNNKTIGVVSLGTTKHTEKLKEIKEDLSLEFGKDRLDTYKLIIEDAPKFQGDERDVMLISLGAAIDLEKLEDNRNSKPAAIINSPDDHQKINVALSRAKEQMILFHSIDSNELKEKDFRKKIILFFYDVKPIMDPFELPENIEYRNRHNVPEPFDSWFEYDIAKELKQNNYHFLEPQYKVKEDEQFFNYHTNSMTYVNFKLDIVVHNNNKMVAIECDGDPFHSLPEDVAYDTERQEFLERVGWKVYRILYSSYKRNPTLEIENLVQYLERNTKKDNPIQVYQPDQDSSLINDDIVELETMGDEMKESFENNGTSYIEPDQTENPINSTFKSRHRSYIDELESQTKNNFQKELFEQTEVGINTKSDDIGFRESESLVIANKDEVQSYYNLFSNGKYCLSKKEISEANHKLPILKSFENGEFLMFYENGKINKVQTKSLLHKEIDHLYANGQNRDQDLIKLQCIKEEMIFAICYTKNGKNYFKAHKTSQLKPENNNLLLTGKKVLYDDFEKVKYKILPMGIEIDLNTLLMKSLQSSGKPVTNQYYQKQWILIEKFWPEIFN